MAIAKKRYLVVMQCSSHDIPLGLFVSQKKANAFASCVNPELITRAGPDGPIKGEPPSDPCNIIIVEFDGEKPLTMREVRDVSGILLE